MGESRVGFFFGFVFFVRWGGGGHGQGGWDVMELRDDCRMREARGGGKRREIYFRGSQMSGMGCGGGG